MKIAIINGPNLNLLGTREKDIYGNQRFEDYMEILKKKFPDVELVMHHSNVEGELVNLIQQHRHWNGIVFNGGAYTHTSLAIADAIAAIEAPVVEVHISNIFAREDYRHVSYTGARAVGSISGLGLKGYELGVRFLIEKQ